ncbi:MAG: ATP-dependent Clp protease ATP-binding subunit [Chloroflexi bacterium]|nr:ATP-dependent Clp protease ATP-binding subunit [Chloroflexota bacterium]
MARTLLRRTKSNPVLPGDAGVGKTAIVEALAQRIAAGNVRPELRDLRIVEIPVAALVAGTQYRGEFEPRLRQLVAEVRGDPRIVLFFDEVHTLLGAGAAEGAPLDAANILKPALARGEVRCIGATTFEEYRRHVEGDAALARRFQPLAVGEPSPGEALAILRQLAPRFAQHHGVRIDDAALDAAVRLAVSYLPERRLPDKAIDLLDEACARVRLRTLRPSEGGQAAIGADDVAAALADWTGIAAGRLMADERQQLRAMEDLLAQRVFGQAEAVAAVARVLRLARTGLKDPNRPVGVLLFLGPTGVGKTEMARAVADVLYGDPDWLSRFDMSEYGEAHTVSRLIGAPPGYVGHDEPGQLSEALRRRPQSVVLFDEIEKAHPQVLDLFLQLVDAGRLTDARGHVVDGRQALFIVTSNLGTTILPPPRPIGFVKAAPPAAAPGGLVATLAEALRPEFINRVDAIVPFLPLGLPDLERIAQRLLHDLAQRAAAQGVALDVAPAAVAVLAALGLDPAFGARPLRRAVERLVAEPLAQLLLRDRPPAAVRVAIDADAEVVVAPADDAL